MELSYTKDQTESLRQKIIDEYVVPIVKNVFEKYPKIRSATFTVAQYWNDNANDEVHNFFLFSVLETPDWEAFTKAEQEDRIDSINLPDFETNEYFSYFSLQWDARNELEKDKDFYRWYGMSEEIPAFAAYAPGGAHQSMDYSEAYNPYAILYRKDNDVEVKIVGKMLRPWLDGIKPEKSW